MTDTLISDAVAFPQDEGFSGIDDNQERWMSAGYLAGLARMVGDSAWVQNGLSFTNHDSGADEVDLSSGRAYIPISIAVDIQSDVGGTSPPAYDTATSGSIPIMVIVPSTVSNLPVQDSTLSAVWLAYDNDGTGPGSAGSVYVRTDETGSESAPSHPSVKIGEANPDDSSADTRANDNPTETFKSIKTDKVKNSAVGDEVNYIDPAWLARTDAGYYIETFDSLDPFTEITDSGASVSLENRGVKISSGSTTDNRAFIENQLNFVPLADETFEVDRTFSLQVDYATTAGPIYVSLGNPDIGNLTRNHIGIVVESGDLKATTADGINQTKTTLKSGISAGIQRVRVELDATNGTVTYFDETDTELGSISSTLPNGASNAGRISAFAQSDGTDQSATLNSSVLVQSP